MKTELEHRVSKSAMRWNRFVDAYINNGFEKRSAALEAGYTPEEVKDGIAEHLLKQTEVIRLLRKRQAKVAEKYAITRDFIFEGLEDAFLMAKENNNPSAMVSAMEKIAKVAGLMVEKGETAVTHSWADLLDEESKRKKEQADLLK